MDESALHPRPRFALLVSLIAPVALIGGWSMAAAAQPGGFDQVNETISALAAQDTPHRWIMTSALVLAGIGHLLTALALGPARLTGRLVLGAGGLATIGVALVPLPSRTVSSTGHVLVASLAFALLAAWPWFARRRAGVSLLRPRVTAAAVGVLGGLALMLLVWVLDDLPAVGLVERVAAGAQSVWPFAVAVSAWWWAGRPVGSPRVRHALGGAGLVLAAAVGGVVATDVAPTTVHTTYYEASVSLSANPFEASRLHASTIFGDLEVDFTGIAPGVEVQPRVRDSITQVFARGGVSVNTLQPSQSEIDQAVRQAAIGIGIRFLIGALLACLAAVVVYAAIVRGGFGRRHLIVAVAVTAAVSLVAAMTATMTYQPDRLRTFTAGGLLGTVQRNANLLSDVTTRANQTAPYVANLLALSAALQRKYAPQQLDRTNAARILLVSDIHGANLYPMMKAIIDTENIDAVIDSGDLVNFGTVAEASAANMFSGIASLGVPYIFARGNHDATSPTDHRLLDRLGQIPNVTLLQPGPDTYQEADVNGIRIAGFNDPRWFGDDNRNNAAKQVPAREQFVRTFRDRTPLDIVVSHEPSAVQGIDFSALRVNGHIHSQDLEGNRIGVGTFSGGGPFSHFLQGAKGEELTGQPSAFDVLSFGTDCTLTSLARYKFHDVIEGYPAYDDIMLINGSTVATPPAKDAPPRSCSHSVGYSVDTVPAVAAQQGSESSSTSTSPGSTPSTSPTPGSTTTTSPSPTAAGVRSSRPPRPG